MRHLVAVSLLWAFSFGLIKNQLAGLDSLWVATTRLALALLVFLPWLRPRVITVPGALRYAAIGAVEFGLMYVFYIAAFRHLQAHEVAMFTIFTPIYVVLIDGVAARRVQGTALAAALLAGLGAAVLKWRGGLSAEAVTGFLLVQGSNLAFALGQVAYRRTRRRHPEGDNASIFAWLYLGAVFTAGILALIWGDLSRFQPTPAQWSVLVYLGTLASGLGFFLWNVGATRVSAPILAVSNNLLVPLAVLVALIVFGESAPLLQLGASCLLMALALLLAKRSAQPPLTPDRNAP